MSAGRWSSHKVLLMGVLGGNATGANGAVEDEAAKDYKPRIDD